MRWMVAVGSGVLWLGLGSCGGSRPGTEAHASGRGQAAPSKPEGSHGHGAGGNAGSGGVAGNGYDGGSTCPSGPVTTCPGTMSGRWCVETFPLQTPADSPQGVWSDRADNAWVVGWRSLANGEREALLMHWNGCEWTDVPNPDPVQFQYARGVWGVAANDLWIVGVGSRALHFDGESLSLVPVPGPDGDPDLREPLARGSESFLQLGQW